MTSPFCMRIIIIYLEFCRGDIEQPYLARSPCSEKWYHVYMYGEFDDEFVMEDPYSLDLQLDKIVNFLLEKKQ
ncbi:hypothetical protein AABM34_14925 [Lysinibacillus fusiformis]